MTSLISLKNKKHFFIFSVIFVFPFVSNADTLLQDDFAGTNIDINKWIEYDPLGDGGSFGNIK